VSSSLTLTDETLGFPYASQEALNCVGTSKELFQGYPKAKAAAYTIV
jgi:hypothetical protein